MTGAIIALTSRAIFLAIATGAVMSAPLLITPCGSSVPVGSITVLIFEGTASLNSIQLMSLISRVVTTSADCAAEGMWIAAIKQTGKSREYGRIIAVPPDTGNCDLWRIFVYGWCIIKDEGGRFNRDEH